MKIAFVAGFFDPVKEAVEETYPEHLKNGSVIWIPQEGAKTLPPPRAVNLNQFVAQFLDRVKHAKSVLILLAIPTGEEWVENKIWDIVEKGVDENPGLSFFDVVSFKNASDRAGVLKAIKEFDLPTVTAIGVEKIRARVPQGKILCVSCDGKTSILDALRRAGFAPEAIDACFEEEKIHPGKNSNLMDLLSERAKHHPQLLYAWDGGLRYLQPKVKRKFSTHPFEAMMAAKVVERFKEWITEDV
jgi:hypothetical protein